MLQDLDVLPAQARALRIEGTELLIAAEPQSGASHLLRTMAIWRAWQRRQMVVFACANEEKLREHLRGVGGFFALLNEASEKGAAVWDPGGIVRLPNGSSIHVTTWDLCARRNPDLLLLDDGEELGYAQFQRLRDKTLRGPSAAGDALPRVILASHQYEQGWQAEHFAAGTAGRVRAELRHLELPLALRKNLPAAPPRLLFRAFVQRVFPHFPWYDHTELLTDVLQRVVDGEIPRLIIQAPPRYYKSLLVSRLLPAYWLHDRPQEFVTTVSAEESLALTFSKDARFFYGNAGGLFRPDAKEAALWRTLRGGGMWARSIGQGALGRGFNLGVVDDPFTSWENAQRQSIQDAVEEYFWRTFYNRRDLAGTTLGEKREAAIVVMQQRLAEGDLVGRLLKREQEAKVPAEGWHLLDLPALKHVRQVPFPPSVAVIPDTREEGEPLCDALQGREELLRLQASDSISFASIYQQDPLPDIGGELFAFWWWRDIADASAVQALRDLGLSLNDILLELVRTGQMPELHREARAWDFAATEGAGDWTASTRGGVTLDEEFIFTDAFDKQIPAYRVKDTIIETALRDGVGVDVILPQEPAAAGKILYTDIQMALEALGFTVVITPTSGSKWVRAHPHAGAARHTETGGFGRCYVVPGPWVDRWVMQHHRFDGITKPMDLVDSASELFSELNGGSGFKRGGFR